MHTFGHQLPRRRPSERALEKLWLDFIKLQRVRAEVRTDFGYDDSGKCENCEDLGSELVAKVFAPIDDELRHLASRAAAIASKGTNDLEYKAVMLTEFLGANDRSIYVALANSLVADIKRGTCAAAA